MTKKSSHKRHKKISKIKGLKLGILIFVALVVLGGIGWLLYSQLKAEPTPKAEQSQEIVVQQNLPAEPTKKGTLKTLTGNEFRDLYNSFAYPNTEFISEDAVITGKAAVDSHIQKLAEDRGYVRRSAPVSDTFKAVQDSDMLLQERAAQPWIDMKLAAKKEQIILNLTAAYRSAAEQREIFISRIGIPSSNYEAIATGRFDDQINQVLSMTAIPGYSRHHTGYTIDIGCQNQPTLAFENTVCFEWLSANNYKNAKTFGWIPSYPEGAGKQGPEPETWEYVWVGKDVVTE